MDHTEPLQASQRLNIILTRPSQAHDEARAASVNTVELGTPWHIVDCLYFLFSLLNNGGLSDRISMATQPSSYHQTPVAPAVSAVEQEAYLLLCFHGNRSDL